MLFARSLTMQEARVEERTSGGERREGGGSRSR